MGLWHPAVRARVGHVLTLRGLSNDMGIDNNEKLQKTSRDIDFLTAVLPEIEVFFRVDNYRSLRGV